MRSAELIASPQQIRSPAGLGFHVAHAERRLAPISSVRNNSAAGSIAAQSEHRPARPKLAAIADHVAWIVIGYSMIPA
jgi:hypothetical protein